MPSDDTNSLRHRPRRSRKNCDLQFANSDIFKENYSKDYYSYGERVFQLVSIAINAGNCNVIPRIH